MDVLRSGIEDTVGEHNMNRFRIVPPPQVIEEEKPLHDELFLRRAVKCLLSIRPDYMSDDKPIITCGHNLKIYRCDVYEIRDNSSNGVFVYWEYQDGTNESSLYIGEHLTKPPPLDRLTNTSG